MIIYNMLEDTDLGSKVENAPLIETINVVDSRISNCSPTLNFGVFKSGMNVNQYQEKASSASPNGCSWNVVVPSMSTIVDRVVYIRSQLTFTLGTSVAAGQAVFADTINPKYIVPSPFPFHQMTSNVNCQLNNQSFSLESKQLLPLIHRMLDKDTLDKYCSATPHQYGLYYNSVDVPDPSNNCSSSWGNFGNALDNNMPMGSYLLTFTDATNSGGSAATTYATITMNIVEPVLMSPFLLSNMVDRNSQGLYGINNIKLTYNFNTSKCRSLRIVGFTPADANTTLSLSAVSVESYLDFTFLTPHPSQARSLVPRNVCQYISLDRQTTPIGNQVLANGTFSFPTNSIQLNSVPDSVMICIRKREDNKDCRDTDGVLPITNISINFGNRSGILSNATVAQLYAIARENGVNSYYHEFAGTARGFGGVNKATSGSYLLLKFGKDIVISDDYVAPGSLGTYQFFATVSSVNNTGSDIAQNTLECVCMFVYPSVLVNESASTTTYTGLLAKTDVLAAADKEMHSGENFRLMYGGSWWRSLGSFVKKYVAPVAKSIARPVVEALPLPSNVKSLADSGLKKLGWGQGGNGGGARSGGRKGRRVDEFLM